MAGMRQINGHVTNSQAAIHS